MPHFNLRYFLETLSSKQQKEVFVLQIGAMDGKTFDPVHEYISRFHWNALMVEPMEEHFKTLCQTYASHSNIMFENTAIAEHSGVATLHYIPHEYVHTKAVPVWGKGVASFYKDRNALAFDTIKPLISKREVPCITLPELLAKHNIKAIDVLQIDTEGYDYHIIKQLDFTQYLPKVINMEMVNLPKNELRACKALLDNFGYLHTKAGYDLLAVQPSLLIKL